MKINICRTVYDQETSELIEVREVLQMIKSSEDLKSIQDTYRKQTFSNKADKQTYKAGHFKSVTFNGSFELETRITNDTLQHGSGLAMMDLDDVTEKGYNLKEFKQKIFNEKPFVVAVFISPSNNGLKVLVKIPVVNSKKLFRPIVMALMKEFPSELVDGACKDVRRMTYLAHDPDLLVRNYENAQLFEERYFEPAYTPKYDVFEDFKERGPSIESMLVDHSWQTGKENGNKLHVYRPEKEGLGPPSGSIIDGEVLYLFTDATDIDPEKAHDKVSVFNILYGGKDYKRSRELMVDQGFGKEVITKPGTNGQDNFKNNGKDTIKEDQQKEEAWERFIKETEELKTICSKEPVKLNPIIINEEGVEVLYEASLLVIQGGFGVGKSRVAQAIASVIIRNDPNLIVSGFKIKDRMQKDYVLVYVDTERNKKTRLPKAIQQIRINAGLDPLQENNNLEYTSLRRVAYSNRKDFLKRYIEMIRKKHEGKRLLFILDISTDMVSNFNEIPESQELVDFINELIDEYDCSGIAIIHKGKNSENSLGHLGSELDRKCTSMIDISNAKGIKMGIDVTMRKQGEGEKGEGMLLVYDKETDAFQYDGIETGARGINPEIRAAIHKGIKIGEELFQDEIIDKMGLDKGKRTIQNALKTMTENGVPVQDENRDIVGWLKRVTERDTEGKGKSNKIYYKLEPKEKGQES